MYGGEISPEDINPAIETVRDDMKFGDWSPFCNMMGTPMVVPSNVEDQEIYPVVSEYNCCKARL